MEDDCTIGLEGGSHLWAIHGLSSLVRVVVLKGIRLEHAGLRVVLGNKKLPAAGHGQQLVGGEKALEARRRGHGGVRPPLKVAREEGLTGQRREERRDLRAAEGGRGAHYNL